jgi:hypothetical protein
MILVTFQVCSSVRSVKCDVSVLPCCFIDFGAGTAHAFQTFCDATKQFPNPANVRAIQGCDTCSALGSLSRVIVVGRDATLAQNCASHWFQTPRSLFWAVTPCCLVDTYECLRRTSRFHLHLSWMKSVPLKRRYPHTEPRGASCDPEDQLSQI